jgi:preprotein translocase subunit SecG
MTTLLVLLHVIICIGLIIIVLLQTGKGAEIGATFGGGGSHTLFGSRGAGNFLTKATAVIGAVFMLTSLALAMMSSNLTAGSVVEELPAKKPGAAQTAPVPAQGAPFAPVQQGGAPEAPAAPAPGGGK